MEKAPGEGPDFVEELEGDGGSCAVDGACTGEETKMGVDLFRGGVGDSVVVQSISARATGAFGEVCRNRRRGSNHLISDRFEWSGNLHHQRDSDAGCGGRFVEGVESG